MNYFRKQATIYQSKKTKYAKLVYKNKVRKTHQKHFSANSPPKNQM